MAIVGGVERLKFDWIDGQSVRIKEVAVVER